MPIVMITEALLRRARASDGRILRDRVLCGFCVRLLKRRRTFMIATSIAGKQFRMTLGHWPQMTVEQARAEAVDVLRHCRAGRMPFKNVANRLPSLGEMLEDYCKAKKLRDSTLRRYASILRTHFHEWIGRPVNEMASPIFGVHCKAVSQNNGAAVVELIRGLIGALCKYCKAVFH